jgi:uncharacterized repeat protein (TIGR01451 family)
MPSHPSLKNLVRGGLLALAASLLVPALAAADAPDVQTAVGSVLSSDASGIVVEVHGTWAWPTHGSDCNKNRAGVGVAIDWGDPTGNHVTDLNGDSIDVGVAGGGAATRNPIDNLVHPAEPPSLANDTAANWESFCGQFVNGTPQGTFGYVVNSSGQAVDANGNTTTDPDKFQYNLTHTYPAGFVGQLNICALTYDVHGSHSLAPPNGTKETTAGGTNHNSDNSAEKNASTPAGNRCAPIHINNHPALTTDAGPTKTLGSVLEDKATLSLAGANATGTITFKVYGPDDVDCSGPVRATSTVNVAGNGVYTSTTGFKPTSVGTYRWIANYSGDANNDATANTCNEDNENVDVGQTTPRVTTNAGSAVSVGTPMHDTATLTGASAAAGGTITFKLYGPNDASCTGTVRFTSTKTVSGNNTYTSSSFTPTTAGTYHWIANYSGDANNKATTNGCNGANENVVVNRLNPSVTTNAGAAVALSNPIHDVATLSGATATATGTISFSLYGPDDASCSFAIFTTSKTVSGNGNYTSADFTPTAAGTYRWVANYSGDTNNSPTTNGCNEANENVAVNKAGPSVTTNAGNDVPLGTAIKDTATLSGGQNPTGSITFKLYGPNDATCQTVIFTSVKTVAGNDNYQSGTFTPTTAGTYRWVANYGGDTNNSATSNGCNGQNENVVVGKLGPTVTTDAGADVVLGATLHDSATLAGGSSPTGKISFDLYGPNDGTCSTSIFHSETVVNGNGPYQSTGFKPTAAGVYRWVANYSGDANNNPTTNACNGANENVTVTANATIKIVKTGPASALAGDDVAFTLTVTNPGDQPLSNVVVTDARCDASGPDLQSKTGGNQDNVLDPPETWTYTCSAHTTAGQTNLHNVGSVCATPPAGAQVCDTSPKDVPLRNPDISIDKAGPATITAGGTINYTLDVTNTGDQRFAESKVVLTDPKCDATPTLSDKNGDTSPSFLDPGDTWRYLCSHVTKSSDTGTYHNVGTVTGTDEHNDVVSDDDDADTVINPGGCTANCSPPCTANCGPSTPHPGIAINKTGPATANAGDTIPYLLDVSNTGDQPFAEANLSLTDQLCGATPTLSSKNGDQTPAKLNPGETWTYTCSVPTVAGQTNVHNVGSVTGVPDNGPPQSASDFADTVLANQGVLPLLPGVSRLRGPTGCVSSATHVLTVTGSRIARVSFYVDGRYIGTRTKANRGKAFTLTIRGAKLRRGSHRVTARVTYQSGTNPQTKTLTLAFARCARAVTPKFTG